mgnify:CR=1 FL=1
MNEKSIRAPFMLAKLKFCRPIKAPAAICLINAGRNCIKLLIEMEHRNASGVPVL